MFAGRRVGAVQTTRLLDPPGGVREVDEARPGRRAGAAAGDVRRDVRPSARSPLQVLWPLPDSPTRGPGDGSTANEASVVLLVEVGGLAAAAHR